MSQNSISMSKRPRPPGVPSTAEMLEMLDRVTQDIPKMLESLGNAIGTLVDKNTDPNKVDVWERNLKGFSGQYYGRLATCQNALRTVIRHMHTLRVDPHTIRPPSSNIPPPAFASPGPDKPYAPSSSQSHIGGQSEMTEDAKTTESDDSLSLYAARLELKALQDMQKALQTMMNEDIEADGNTDSLKATSKESSPEAVTARQHPETSIAVPETTALASKQVEETDTIELDLPQNDASTSNPATGGLGGLADYADSDASDVDMEEAPN